MIKIKRLGNILSIEELKALSGTVFEKTGCIETNYPKIDNNFFLHSEFYHIRLI